VAALIAAVTVALVVGTAVSLAFAFRAEARALEAGLMATRSRVMLAQTGFETVIDASSGEPRLRAPDEVAPQPTH
jgi:hypothetical protein